jgi:hypothetical protein
MDAISEVSKATIEALFRNYMLWIGILTILLAFVIYVYLFPQSIDFFANPEKPSEEKKGCPTPSTAPAADAASSQEKESATPGA